MVLAAAMRASAVALQACSDFLRFAFNAPKGSNKRCQKALSIINATMRHGRRAQRVGDRVRTYLTVQHASHWVGGTRSQCRPRRRLWRHESRALKYETLQTSQDAGKKTPGGAQDAGKKTPGGAGTHTGTRTHSGCRYVGVTVSSILKSFVPVSFVRRNFSTSA
jgi:hypothetical protein